MKIFQCDKRSCKRKVKENFDLLKLDIKNGNVTQDFMDKRRLPDICKICAAEFEKLKLEIMKENAKKIKEWWNK